MELEHSFTVPVPADQAWDVLLDVERVAPCMPGATLDSVDGDEIKGKIKVKLGPVSITYAGTAEFTERDRGAGVVTLKASGKETRGAGTAAATVRSELRDQGDQTEVTVHTSLNVTGRPAQLGRGLMSEVSAKLIGVFANNLADMLATGNGAAPEAAVPEATVQATSHAEPATVGTITPARTAPATAPSGDSLNLLEVAGLPLLKRIAAPAGALLVALAGVLIWRRRRRR
ncbi:MAG TPA: SRPBCC family protein [Streptosporangiaceae bacterium]|nr:SRPBCC family protein [Streptosporangiaceae bacterium]